jgi:hypothetical protein
MKRLLLAAPLVLASCVTTFRSDMEFLKAHTDVIELNERDGNARIAICPLLQGRVMTSTATGRGGMSYGWINYDLVASGEKRAHINVYGGEDRFWLGPEGGQFSIFFKKGDPFDLEHWQTPAPIDTEPFEVVKTSEDRVTLKKVIQLVNASGFAFTLDVHRDVKLIRSDRAWEHLQMPPQDEVRLVAFETMNKVTNSGVKEWKKETGLLSVWILGMFQPSDRTTVVVPYRAGAGPQVNDAYFGKVPGDRLAIRPKKAPNAEDGVIYFKGDGQLRSKIGVSPHRARPVLGSWDASNDVLTIVQYTLPGSTDYVNSMWETQKEPYAGDAVNSYNDGPAEPGAKPLGPFYELESSSPALALRPGQSAIHVHRTVHLQGSRKGLNRVARHVLGAELDEIESAFAP